MKRRTPVGLLSVLTLAFLPVTMSSQTVTAQPCGDLEQVPTPNPGATNNALIDIAASGDGTAWAIGTASGPSTIPLLLFFDGNEWSEYPVPSELTGFFFSAACATPEGDVWLSGAQTGAVVFMRARDGEIDRIDYVSGAGAPIDLSASSSTNVWGITGATDAIHFDGSDWASVGIPDLYLLHNYGKGIYAAGPNDVWAVGYGGDGRGDYFGYAHHWDGSSWTPVQTPFDGLDQTFFRGIDGSGPDDIWVVGNTAIGTSNAIAMHWDGSAWTQVEGAGASLSHVVAVAPDDVWAAPYSLTPGADFFHWDGSAWNPKPSPQVSGASSVNWRGMTKTGTCEVWAAGSYYVTSHNTLTAKLSDEAPSSAPEISSVTGLVGSYPNPFRASTEIVFSLPGRETVRIDIVDATGSRVARLLERSMPEGLHRVQWSGLDDAGRSTPSGIYFYRMETEQFSRVRKIMKIQ